MARGLSTVFLVGKVVGDAKVRKGPEGIEEARLWVNVSRAKYQAGGGDPEWVENLIMVQGLGPYAEKIARVKDGARLQVIGSTSLVPYHARTIGGDVALDAENRPIERKRLVVVASSPGHQVVEGGTHAANRVVLIGRVGGDPDVKVFESGGMSVRINLAVDRYNPKGEQDDRGRPKDDTIWHSVSFKGKRAEAAGEHIKKGDMVIIEGQLETEEWEKDGVKSEMTRVVTFGFDFAGKRGGGGDVSRESAANREWGDGFGDYDDDFGDLNDGAPRRAPASSGRSSGGNQRGQFRQAPPKQNSQYDFDDEIPF